jgi:hypothetical protein
MWGYHGDWMESMGGFMGLRWIMILIVVVAVAWLLMRGPLAGGPRVDRVAPGYPQGTPRKGVARERSLRRPACHNLPLQHGQRKAIWAARKRWHQSPPECLAIDCPQ